MPDSYQHSEHGQRIMDLAARFTGLVDIERNARIEIVGKIAGEVVSLEGQLEDYKRAAAAWHRNYDLLKEEKKRILEQLETLQREHSNCHEKYDVVLRTWRERALKAEATHPQLEDNYDPMWESGDARAAGANPASRLYGLTTDDSQNEPPDLETDDDFEV